MGKHKIAKVLIWGAGDAGAMILKEILDHKDRQDVIGFIDDDISKLGGKIFDKKILGDRSSLKNIIKQYEVDEVYIAMPSVGNEILSDAMTLCQSIGVAVKTLPTIYELIDGWVHLNQLKTVSSNDLLGRKPIFLKSDQINKYLLQKTILVTGAGGSIGSEICRQLIKLKVKKIVLLGKGENSIYEIHRELMNADSNVQLIPVIADVRDRDRMALILESYKPNVVFHAAAHKHVPLMEYQPMEAVRNNIIGTKNVAELSAEYGVDKFVLVSTDKAVNPTSVMGCTKRVAEMIVQSMKDCTITTKYVAVRFGNVLGSRGSVVPLFKKQIELGGPVTVTDPDITRFFMTIPEAAQLVLEAGTIAHGGEIFVLNMGKPVKIIDLACEMIRLAGYVPFQDIEIKFTGLRPGEKLYEELTYAEDGICETKNKKIFVTKIPQINKKEFDSRLKKLIKLTNADEIILALKELVPTYHPNHKMED